MKRRMLTIRLVTCLMVTWVTALNAQDSSTSKLRTNVEAINSIIREDDFTKFDDFAASFIKHRSELNKDLLAVFTDAKSSNYQRCASAFFLGEIRATNAVEALAKSIDLSLAHDTDHISVLSLPPAVEAMVKIGVPALPAVIRNLAESDHAGVRQLSLQVLRRVEGDDDIVRLRLRKAALGEKNPRKAARLHAAEKALVESSLGK